jgi:GAF domain-containing protein
MGWFSNQKVAAPVASAERDLVFSKKLQAVTNKIHATSNLYQIMLDLSGDICDLFSCDRLTLYAASRDKDFIFSKIKTGINLDEDIVLPVNEKSIAGWVALTGRTVCIRNVYDKKELKSVSEDLAFSGEMDRMTGYRTKQMLAAPLLRANTAELLGVIQLLNSRADNPFSEAAKNGLDELCETMAIAFTQRMKSPLVVKSKYDPLIADAVISGAEMELAARSARRQNIDIEDVLVDEFNVNVGAIGRALGKNFNIPYEPFVFNRKTPVQLLQKIDLQFIESNHALPIEDDGRNIVILTTDPERAERSRAVKQIFPYSNLFYRVTTKREFNQTVDYFYGAQAGPQ